MERVSQGAVLARFGHALSDPVRSRLLLALRDGPGYPAELAELLGTSRQNLSNHLACLRGCGLVVAVPEGRRSRYELADARIAHALGDLLGLVLAVDPAARTTADPAACTTADPAACTTADPAAYGTAEPAAHGPAVGRRR